MNSSRPRPRWSEKAQSNAGSASAVCSSTTTERPRSPIGRFSHTGGNRGTFSEQIARLKISADCFCARVLEFFSVTVFGATVFVLFETRLVHLLTDATKLFDRLNSSRQIVVSSSPVHRRREASNLVRRSIKRHCPTFRNQ